MLERDINGDTFEVNEKNYLYNWYDHCVVAYTDGCCRGNHTKDVDDRIAGSGVFFGDENSFNLSLPLNPYWGEPTNNKAEIQAAYDAVWQARAIGFRKLIIRTDSKFLVRSMEKDIYTWMNNRWRKANRELVKNRHEFYELYKESEGMVVTYEHVDAHSNIHGNEEADKLAKDGAEQYTPGSYYH